MQNPTTFSLKLSNTIVYITITILMCCWMMILLKRKIYKMKTIRGNIWEGTGNSNYSWLLNLNKQKHYLLQLELVLVKQQHGGVLKIYNFDLETNVIRPYHSRHYTYICTDAFVRDSIISSSSSSPTSSSSTKDKYLHLTWRENLEYMAVCGNHKNCCNFDEDKMNSICWWFSIKKYCWKKMFWSLVQKKTTS